MKEKGITLKVVLIPTALAIIVAVMFSFFKNNSDNAAAKEHAPLAAYTYSFGGDMQGGSTFLKIEKSEEGKALVSYSRSEWHNTDPEVAEYLVSDSALKEIEKIYDKNKMYLYPKLGRSNMIALDAGSGSYCFKFSDGSEVQFSSTQNIPDKGYEGLNKIRALIDEAQKQGERLAGLAAAFGEECVNTLIPENECRLLVYEYIGNTLFFRISNGTSESVPVSGKRELFRVADGSREKVAENFGDEELLDSDSIFEDSLDLGMERLSAGRYVLAAGGFEAEFEIG